MKESKSKLISKPGKQDYQTLERELRKARKELALKEKEIIVLKKVTAYFAKAHV